MDNSTATQTVNTNATSAPSANGSSGANSAASSNSSVSPAYIKVVDKGTGIPDLKCLFNPKAYTFSKKNDWKGLSVGGKSTPKLEFSGGQNATLQMQLYFDTYLNENERGKPRDVRTEYTDHLWKMMMVNQKLENGKNKKGRPPIVQFLWGDTWSFKAIIQSLSQKFTLFAPSGTPVRAVVDVTFQQVENLPHLAPENLPPQNPTSAGVGGERAWSVVEGDTLAWIAYQSYGDASEWRHIADVNHLDRVRKLAPGTVLLIPNI